MPRENNYFESEKVYSSFSFLQLLSFTSTAINKVVRGPIMARSSNTSSFYVKENTNTQILSSSLKVSLFVQNMSGFLLKLHSILLFNLQYKGLCRQSNQPTFPSCECERRLLEMTLTRLISLSEIQPYHTYCSTLVSVV